ncbi:hypothetical protein [uncultured Algibacter sp.]|uniref:hypothetical protein n=1 Tax=uncultured Algibacter sp. TaxID=298659 RepID=UPI0026152453|nr:hypothetical protein [uncultured Algibacter sp.]
MTSRDSIKSRVKNILTNYRVRLKDWKSIDIIIRNDIAIHRHSGVLVLMPKTDSTEIDISLKYLDILKKNENGEWRVYIHSNMPDK